MKSKADQSLFHFQKSSIKNVEFFQYDQFTKDYREIWHYQKELYCS